METALTVLSIVGTVSSVCFAYLAFARNRRKDDAGQGQHSGTILTEIGYIKSGIDDIKKKQEVQDARYLATVERLAAVESSVELAHRRLDDLAACGTHGGNGGMRHE